MAFILFENDSPESLSHLGGAKALLLKQLAECGARVPPWFCVSHAAPERFVRGYAATDLLENFSHQVFFTDAQFVQAAESFAKEVEKRFLGCSMSPEIAKEILANRATVLGAKDQAVAIRMSRGREERAVSSPVYLNIVSDFEVLYDVRAAWAAAYTVESLARRRRMGLLLAPAHVGVIVQKMVLADLAGRAMTAESTSTVKVEVHSGESGRLTPLLLQIEQTALKLAEASQGPVAFSWAAEQGELWFLG